MNQTYRWLWAILTLLFATAITHAQKRDEAEALKQRFIAHLSANTPIAGEFEVHGTSDPETYQQRLKVAEAKNDKLKGKGFGYQIEKADRSLVCRWAFDRDKEMLETLPASKGIYKTFLHDGETLLEGFEGNGTTRSFNLVKGGHVMCWRPANFYFLCGMQRMTVGLHEWESVAVEVPAADAPRGTVVLVLRDVKNKGDLRLLLERETCVLHGFDFLFDSKPFRRLTIQEHARSPDNRVFPTRAELLLYHPKNPGRPSASEILVAKRVSFPKTKQDADAAFALNIPGKSLVGDQILNQGAILDRSVPAERILTQPLPSPLPLEKGTNVDLYLSPARSKLWYWVGGVGCAVLAAAVAFWVVRRSRRATGTA